jgi:DNA-binding transcriptional MocR family regulator
MEPGKTINPYRLFDGAMIPIWLMERPELSAGAKLTYARLTRYAGAKGVAYPRLSRLAQDLGVSRDSVKRYVKELLDAKLIDVETPGFHRANRYRFLSHVWITSRGGRSAPSRGGRSAPSPIEVDSIKSQKTERVTGQAGAPAAPAGGATRRGPAARRIERLLKDVTASIKTIPPAR